MSLQSKVYIATVMHCRFRPRAHRFRYRSFWLYLDLDELDRLPSRLRFFSRNRFNLFSLNDTDHGDGSAIPLRVQIERHLADAGIDIAGGAIRFLVMPRTLGYSFNPLSIYYCFDVDGTLAAVIYEVHNTFGDRHSYLVPIASQTDLNCYASRKRLHVSPFMDMDMTYDFRLAQPAERLSVAIRVNQCDRPVLTACLAGERHELSDAKMLRLFLTMPAITAKVIVAIHWEALRLWLKGLRLHQRPAPPERPITVGANTAAISD